jgi:SAM-dependent methyltransferase
MDRKVGFLVAGACFLVFAVGRYDSRWSPYYLVSYIAGPNTLSVFVNSSFHQEAVNFSSTATDYRPLADRALAKFSVPYNEYKNAHQGAAPKSVLILGGGTGNDANVALLNDASSVTVVEIDPVIISLGREFNLLRPYNDPKVQIINDDARHYLSKTNDRYDMVIFGTLDSQALLSGYANLRLENYVYTEESFRDARRVLNPTGILGTYYSIWQDWFLGRIYSTVAAAFPGSLKMQVVEDGYLFNTIVVAAKDLPGFNSDPRIDEKFLYAKKSTDDWPYIYLEEPTISRLYWVVIGALSTLILAAFAIMKLRKAGIQNSEGGLRDQGFGAEFFFLGLAFTLLESAAIVRLALLFGTTWMVNSVVFSTVLATILLSNWIVKKHGGLPMMVSWIGLAMAMAANILVPLQLLIGLGFWEKFGASLALVGIPVLLAGNAFSQMFARQDRTGYALGINLIGAMGGGLIEYVSMLYGMRSVWIVLTVIYTAAFLVWLRKYRTIDGLSVATIRRTTS